MLAQFHNRRFYFILAADLVIFVTPRLLSQSGHLPVDEEKALQQQFLEGGQGKPGGTAKKGK